MGGETVSEPDDNWEVGSEVRDFGDGDLGSGGSSNEKKRESELEFLLVESSLGRPSMSSGRLCRGSSGSGSPGAFSLVITRPPRWGE